MKALLGKNNGVQTHVIFHLGIDVERETMELEDLLNQISQKEREISPQCNVLAHAAHLAVSGSFIQVESNYAWKKHTFHYKYIWIISIFWRGCRVGNWVIDHHPHFRKIEMREMAMEVRRLLFCWKMEWIPNNHLNGIEHDNLFILEGESNLSS
ncbi:MAG: hypothetical protein IPN70_04240 [Candidatus Moraniibacteriota bacterium]|nr:MAG: hypothetical protein IPN70_04240 [Candidatus Moranbacteria bacterium]